MDYLNELTISSEDDPPAFPCVDDEHKHILQHQLELFGLMDQMSAVKVLDSSIINDDETRATQLHDWLKEDESHGELRLLYRSSRDGRDDSIFHTKCDNMGSTLTIIETTDGLVIGGYTNTAWASRNSNATANKAFLFALSGSDVASPCKMKLKNPNDAYAIGNYSSYGPIFGRGNDLQVKGQNVSLKLGFGYEPGPYQRLTDGTSYTIKELEVYQVADTPQMQSNTKSKKKKAQDKKSKMKPLQDSPRISTAHLTQKKSVFFKQGWKCTTLKRVSKTSKPLLMDLLVEIPKMLLC